MTGKLARFRLSAALAALAIGFAVLGTDDSIASTRKKKAEAAKEVQLPPRQPLNLIISLKKQKLFVYHGTELIDTGPVSTGQRGFPTPSGVFSILEKNRIHHSNIYSGAPMPFMQRVTWSGVALHAGALPGYPASHGCIRLPHSFAQKLFGMTRMNNHIIITRSEIAPVEISHKQLFQPAPKAASATPAVVVTASLTGTASDATPAVKPPSTAPIRLLIARRSERDLARSTQEMLKELKYEIGEVDGYIGPVSRDIMRIYQRIHGLKQTDVVSAEVLDHLSRATGRGPAKDWHIYAKQEFTDLFDAPIDIRDPDQPTGTLLFQSQEFSEGAIEVRWTVMPGDEASAAFGPASVLDRIDIPADTRERIAKLLTPGSSLIVTDRGKSDEISKYTDFLVKLPVAQAKAAVASADAGEEPAQTVRSKRKHRAARTVRSRSRASAIASRHVKAVQR